MLIYDPEIIKLYALKIVLVYIYSTRTHDSEKVHTQNNPISISETDFNKSASIYSRYLMDIESCRTQCRKDPKSVANNIPMHHTNPVSGIV